MTPLASLLRLLDTFAVTATRNARLVLHDDSTGAVSRALKVWAGSHAISVDCGTCSDGARFPTWTVTLMCGEITVIGQYDERRIDVDDDAMWTPERPGVYEEDGVEADSDYVLGLHRGVFR